MFRGLRRVSGGIVLPAAVSVAYGSSVCALGQVNDSDATKNRRFMVDCGSGYTRVERFDLAEDGLICCKRNNRSADGKVDGGHMPPLHRVLVQSVEQQTEWLELLDSVTDTEASILIGATGGVRDALATGAIQQQQVTDFRELVQSRYGGRASFVVCSGTEEARAELEGTRYCVLASPFAAELGLTGQPAAHSVGLLSSGGMSSQLVTQTHCVSLDSKVRTCAYGLRFPPMPPFLLTLQLSLSCCFARPHPQLTTTDRSSWATAGRWSTG
jgi:hypothetical protein